MRIASLLPSATEIIFALGKGQDLVARTHECDFPPEAEGVPAVTTDLIAGGLPASSIDAAVAQGVTDSHTIYELDEAALLQAGPDIVITQSLCGVCAVATEQVEAAMCTMPDAAEVASTDPRDLEGVLEGIIEIGVAVGAESEGKAMAARFRSRLHWLASILEKRDALRVAVIEWPDPLYAPGHWVPDMVEAAGAIAVLGVAGKPSYRIELDDLAAARPEVIVLAFCGFDLYETQGRFRELTSHPGWPGAARHARVFAVDGSAYFSRPGPRLMDGIEILAWALHRPHAGLRPPVGRGAELIEAGWVDLASLPLLEEATA